MKTAPFVLLDNAQPGGERLRLFAEPTGVILAENADEVPAALQALQAAQRRGLFAAGYLSYELGYAMESRLRPLLPPQRDVPLLWFGLFRGFAEIPASRTGVWLEKRQTGRAYAGPLHIQEPRAAYAEKFARVKNYIAAGDVYQVNLTFPARFAFTGDPLALYARLRARAAAPHCAFLFDGTRHVLSLSPELFFSVEGGVITARPMKGTAPRGGDAGEDAIFREGLAHSEKDRAENLMIVDLIRNDLGRIAETASVRVDGLFEVETYPTVHQMTSTVRADVRPGVAPDEIIRALFPCGSVTGTPKIRAQEIIRELEEEPRGLYCGAIGFFAPDGSAEFNVAIRTVTIAGTEGRLGVGSAIVADSREEAEYAECLLKARYYTDERPSIGLIETLRYDPSAGFVRGELHLARMERGAKALGLTFARADVEAAMQAAVKGLSGPQRLRLHLGEDGAVETRCEPLTEAPAEGWTYAVSPHRVPSGDLLARHKTDWRSLYEEEFRRLNATTGCDQVLFLNERGEVVEGHGTNVFVRKSGLLVTPPLSAGALDGSLRRSLLENGECVEGTLTLDDLESGETWLGNSLRGLVRARRIG